MYIDLKHFRLSSKGQIDLLPKCERSSEIKIYDKSCFVGLISRGGGFGGNFLKNHNITTLPVQIIINISLLNRLYCHSCFLKFKLLRQKVLATREICHKIYSTIVVEIAQEKIYQLKNGTWLRIVTVWEKT